MIEPIMFFGIGFLVASLIGLVFIPLVHNRAVRLTIKRLEASTPLSMAEIQADKDQLRAEFAMSTRRLELSVEQMKAKTTTQLAELSKKTDAINRLKSELGDKTASIFALEAREKALRDQLHTTENEFSVKIASLREAERNLADKQAELSKVGADLDERSVAADSQRIEVVALRTQIDTLKDQVSQRERDAKEAQTKVERERAEAGAAAGALTEERGKVERLGERVGELEKALLTQTTESGLLNKRAQELEGRLAEQMKTLAEREFEVNQLREKVSASQKIESDLRAEITAAEERDRTAHAGIRAEKAQAESQLAQALQEQERLQNEVNAMKREAEGNWAAERVENALLRERINDIAAEIARLTIALESPQSPIEAILAADMLGTSAGKSTDLGPTGESKGNLAERIRALQLKASRVHPAN